MDILLANVACRSHLLDAGILHGKGNRHYAPVVVRLQALAIRCPAQRPCRQAVGREPVAAIQGTYGGPALSKRRFSRNRRAT
ncbi:hypothetical protein [Salinisphaera aquimarina]|uniref:Uncharacterized protein n=1 Tax=Salinisphaera aquimarina TaxID=2094031 RepID=A0ABV7EXG8_9GAMM